MYDELIQSLRCCADDLNLCYTCKFRDKYMNSCDETLKNEAADAIEELSKQILEMGQVGKFLLDVHKINSKMVAPESVPTDSEWWSNYKALLELLYLPRWIPVTERLPKADERDERGFAVPYLVMNGWMRVTARRTKDYWVLFGGTVLEYVTHWMPLPPSQKEET